MDTSTLFDAFREVFASLDGCSIKKDDFEYWFHDNELVVTFNDHAYVFPYAAMSHHLAKLGSTNQIQVNPNWIGRGVKINNTYHKIVSYYFDMNRQVWVYKTDFGSELEL